MEKTTNYKLFKPELGDRVSIGDINENMDILDEKLKEVELIKIDKSRILSTKEEVEAVTEEGFLVDALVAAQLNSDNEWKTGSISATVSTANGYVDVQVSFLVAFDHVPFMTGSTNAGGGSTSVQCAPRADGGLIRVWSSVPATYTVSWVAR